MESARKRVDVFRECVLAELDDCQQAEPVPFDADAVLAELDELEKHLTGESVPLVRTAFLRVFERVTLFWKQVSPRRRELVRAEVTPHFPFCLTTDPSRRVTVKPPHYRRWIDLQVRCHSRSLAWISGSSTF